MKGYAARVGVEVYCPSCFSLKDKRSVIKGLLDRLKFNFNVSAAEVADQDHQRRSVLAIAVVASSKSYLEKIISRIDEEILNTPGLEVRLFEMEDI